VFGRKKVKGKKDINQVDAPFPSSPFTTPFVTRFSTGIVLF